MQHELYTSASIADYAVPDSSPFQASISFLAYVAMTVSVYSSSYANWILSCILDILRNANAQQDGVVTILDIGAGSGRLGYLIIQRLLELRRLWPNPNHVPFQ